MMRILIAILYIGNLALLLGWNLTICSAQGSATLNSKAKLAIGQTLHLYATNIKGPLERDLRNISFYGIDFPCAEQWEISASDLPKTNYKITNGAKEKYYGLKEGMLLWKGFKGADPFFGIEETFMQFIGGMPLYNFEDYSDFDEKGQAIFYIYYNLEDLPSELQTWALIMEYEKIKLKVKLEYNTEYIQTFETNEAGDEAHELKTAYSFVVDEIKGQKTKQWTLIQKDAHPLFEVYLLDKVTSYTGLYNADNPLSLVKYYQEPNFAIEYSFNYLEKDVPTCIPSGEQIYLYPNPNFGKVNIRMINLPPGQYEFGIYNVIGHKMWGKHLDQDKKGSLISFVLPSLEKGVYLYSIKNERGAYLQSRRLMIVEP